MAEKRYLKQLKTNNPFSYSNILAERLDMVEISEEEKDKLLVARVDEQKSVAIIRKVVKEKEEASKNLQETHELAELEGMTKKELTELAEKRGLDVEASMKKADIFALLI